MKKIKYYIIIIITIWSCAQIVQPTGGAVDKTPPSLLSSNPENRTKNFKGKSIDLVFDELVDASSLHNDLFIVPKPEGSYETKVKNKTVSIVFEKAFEENTTYTFNFRNSIKDLSEKNPSKNLKLVISTGNEIDSLKISGTINSLFSKEPILDATVGLYVNDTLPFLKQKPLYFVKTDSSGKFEIENIKNNKYFLAVYTDKNNNLRYDQKDELFGFLSDSLNLQKDTTLAPIEIYLANRTKNKIKRTISREKDMSLTLDKNPLDVKLEYSVPEDSNKISYNLNDNGLNIYKLVDNQIDSIHTRIIIKDSLLTLDTLQQKIYFREERGRKKKTEILNIITDIKNNQELTKNVTYNLYFKTPVVKFEEENIILKTDTLQQEKLQITKLNNHHYNLKVNTKAHNEIELIIPSNTFTDYLGDTNNLVVIKNKILQTDETGIIHGDVKDKTTSKIALLQNERKTETVQKVVFIDNFTFKDIIPGNYNITVIFDENKNGIWDPGDIENLKQPEKVITLREPERVRANFEKTIKIE